MFRPILPAWLDNPTSHAVTVSICNGHKLCGSLSKAYDGSKDRKFFGTYLERYSGLLVTDDGIKYDGLIGNGDR